MIKLILTVDEDFEKDDLIRSLHANEAYSAIDEIIDLFREPHRYGTFKGTEITEKEMDLLEKVYNEIYKISEKLPAQFLF